MISRRHRRAARREGKAPGRRSRAAFPVRGTLAAAARSARRDAGRILAVAIVVSTVAALLEIVVHHFVDPRNVPVSVTADLSASAVSLLGTVFLSGFLGRLVGAAEHGRDRATIRQVTRSLPWGRLVLADILVVVLIIAGVLALVIPGLVILNLLAVVGPVIEIEDRPVLTALRRSAHLVRQHFWSVALLATLPVIVTSEIESVAPEPAGVRTILANLAVRGIAEAVAEAATGLILVQVCYQLISLDAASAARRGGTGGQAAGRAEPGQEAPALPGSGTAGGQPRGEPG